MRSLQPQRPNPPAELTRTFFLQLIEPPPGSEDIEWDEQLLRVGIGAPDVTVDPYSKADTGQVKITLNQFADLAHRQPATTSTTRSSIARTEAAARPGARRIRWAGLYRPSRSRR